jgi:hypothetical protein
MGIIKTAIMTGGGVYAVNKLSKTAEHRNDSRQSQQQQQYLDPQGQNNGNWSTSRFDQGANEPPRSYYGDYRQQQQYQPQHPSYQQYQDSRQNIGHTSSPQYATENSAANDDAYRGGYYNPPPNGPQQGFYQGYQQDVPEGRGSSRTADLASMAMQFVGSRRGDKDDAKKQGGGLRQALLGL